MAVLNIVDLLSMIPPEYGIQLEISQISPDLELSTVVVDFAFQYLFHYIHFELIQRQYYYHTDWDVCCFG